LSLIRGRVVEANLGANIGRKPLLVISNNQRNRALGSALAARITTSDKPDLASIVTLDRADQPLVGRVLCDDIVEVYADEVERDLGALSPGTMRRVDVGLKAALGLR
jgi:mRNA interferase MazF